MNGSMARRLLLALIPVALLTTASLALNGGAQQPLRVAAMPTLVQSAVATPPHVMSAVTLPARTLIAQAAPPVAPNQPAQPADQQAQPAEPQDEPLPELVVDKTSLTQAMADIDQALEQAKLSVTSLDGTSQQRYIQETVNFLAGSADAGFRLMPGASADSYNGVRPLLIQARVTREAAEVQWIAAVQRQLEARAKKLAELAQAGNAEGTVPAPQTPAIGLSATVGPSGVLGTRGVRVEEQATDLVNRAIRQATEALRLAPTTSQGPREADNVGVSASTDQASQTMESVVRTLEAAKKIIQIAIDR